MALLLTLLGFNHNGKREGGKKERRKKEERKERIDDGMLVSKNSTSYIA